MTDIKTNSFLSNKYTAIVEQKHLNKEVFKQQKYFGTKSFERKIGTKKLEQKHSNKSIRTKAFEQKHLNIRSRVRC
jgi:hypothetical protein